MWPIDPERKKIIYITSAISGLLLLLIGGGIFLWRQARAPISQSVTTISTSTTTPRISPLGDLLESGSGVEATNTTTTTLEKFTREKYFISSYYQPIIATTTARVPAYQLPLVDPKETIVNFRDFNRKLPIDSALSLLSRYGFTITDGPKQSGSTTWSAHYANIRQQGLPALVTSDAVINTYQDTLAIINREIEQELFYPALWQVLHTIASQAQERYEARYNRLGVEGDQITEANRLELAYALVGLKLLEPQPSQIKNAITNDKRFFSSSDAQQYSITIPSYLLNDITAELKLIRQHAITTKSPTFLYPRDYRSYAIPTTYQTSEQLKNYYQARTWLTQTLFPVWPKSPTCSDCLLDQSDHNINFLASLYLTHDLNSTQITKNNWALIYKSQAFFQGLEQNSTYLDYQRILEQLFKPNYNLDELFSGEATKVNQNRAAVQKALTGISFIKTLSGPSSDGTIGLRLLRQPHLIDDYSTIALTGPTLGQINTTTSQTLPTTACRINPATIQRCWPHPLDIFDILNIPSAKTILTEYGDANYPGYAVAQQAIGKEIQSYDPHLWHDNNSLALLAALQQLNQPSTGLPSFMTSATWQTKSLETAGASWLLFHRQPQLIYVTPNSNNDFTITENYGYIEPQLTTYTSLLANIKTIKTAFTELHILFPATRSYNRLQALEQFLQRVITITQAEATNTNLTTTDYRFINTFDQQIQSILGDIDSNQLSVITTINQSSDQRHALQQKIIGLNNLLVIYPRPDGKLFIAIGPVADYRYTVSGQSIPPLATWQQVYHVTPTAN